MLLQRLILYLTVKIEYTSLNVCMHIVESRSGEGYDCKDCHLSTPEGLCSQVFNWRVVCYVHTFSHSIKTHLRSSTSGQVQSKSTFRFRPLPSSVLSYLLLLKVAVKMSARRDRRKKLGSLLRCNLPLRSLLNLLYQREVVGVISGYLAIYTVCRRWTAVASGFGACVSALG